MSAMLMGSAGNFLSRNFSTFSRCTAIAPGKPISRQPALLRLPPYQIWLVVRLFYGARRPYRSRSADPMEIHTR
jgi:hypothetical protein